jgi:hypothetical protein
MTVEHFDLIPTLKWPDARVDGNSLHFVSQVSDLSSARRLLCLRCGPLRPARPQLCTREIGHHGAVHRRVSPLYHSSGASCLPRPLATVSLRLSARPSPSGELNALSASDATAYGRDGTQRSCAAQDVGTLDVELAACPPERWVTGKPSTWPRPRAS